MHRKSFFSPLLWVVPVAFSLLLQACPPSVGGRGGACGDTIVVTTFDDRRNSCEVGDCSLYEAILFANFCDNEGFIGNHTIQLSSGVYQSWSYAPYSGMPDSTFGRNSFPTITSNITIDGNGATIRRPYRDIVEEIFVHNYRLFFVAEGASLTINNATLEHGKAWLPQDTLIAIMSPSDRGGAIYNMGTLELNNSTVQDNESRHDGGAIYSSGTLTLRDTVVTGNKAGNLGGAIANSAEQSTTVSGGSFTANMALGGGAIYNSELSEISLSHVSLKANSAAGFGGAIYNNGSLDIQKTSFIGNYARNNPHTFVGERDYHGGAIYSDLLYGATATIQSSTFSDNTADDLGGAIYTRDDGRSAPPGTTILDSTFYQNSSGLDGFAFFVSRGAIFTIKNTIIANSRGADCSSASLIDTAGSENLDSDGTCGFSRTADPNLLELNNNGGQTKNHLPSPGSPAIDTGSECLATDQRDMARPVDGTGDGTVACDIGAVEFQPGESGHGGGGESEPAGSGSTDPTSGDTTTAQPSTPVTPDTVPVAVITFPQDGVTYTADKFDKDANQWYYEVTLQGSGTDAEDGTLSGKSLVWTISPASNNVTVLGSGESLTARLYAPACFGNSYTITLTVTDSDGNVVSTQITVISSLFC
ncbi:hypothetical protein MNBD_NITROSPINAE01-1726 [hydrothermal vent metagenome]|uniref:CSLREA domain-containing protein n=1 Tax=hydrothermal vent metagenome TaxID=652676 RepID=A0A3B1CAH5_9ZZZZ